MKFFLSLFKKQAFMFSDRYFCIENVKWKDDAININIRLEVKKLLLFIIDFADWRAHRDQICYL
jgi:hypothetical protein